MSGTPRSWFKKRTSSPWLVSALAIALSTFFNSEALAEPAMWVIHSKTSTIFLIGTLHLMRHSSEWQSPKLEKALAESSELWLEISDPDNQSAVIPLIQRYGVDNEKPLSSKLNAAEKEKLVKVATEYKLPLANLEPLRPWTAALLLAALPLQKASYDPKSGVDLFLKEEAGKRGEKIAGFETLEEQTKFLAELPEADQVAFLDDTLDDVDKGIEKLDRLTAAWLNGDTQTLADGLVSELKSKAPVLYEKLLVARNIRWAETISKMLGQSSIKLIAVGAGHLVGPDSVQAQLAKRGIKVENY